MTFGALFTLRTRGRRARPEAANEPYPATAGWNERRARVQDEPGPGTPKRRASDRAAQERGQR